MKTTKCRWLTVVALFAAPLAQAQPGHEGPDDFELGFDRLAAYPVATMLCLAVLSIGGWVVWEYVSSRRSSQQRETRPTDRRKQGSELAEIGSQPREMGRQNVPDFTQSRP